jgi:hypothetical protein
MKLVLLSVVLAALGVCSQADNSSANRFTPAKAVEQGAPAVMASNQMGAYPSTQPDGSPLTDEYCFKVDQERENPFDNTKTCLIVACDAGDKASCDWAATYNGNLEEATAAVARPVAKPAKLEGMHYDKARAVILGYGWKPFPGECGGPPVEKSTCARYPELGYCQGTGRGFCGMTFSKGDRCLHLTTVESPPGQGGYTVVYEVHFGRGSCPQDPN